MGILCAGGVSSGIYPTDSAKQVDYLVNDSRTRILFVEDEEQLDKVIEVRGAMSHARSASCLRHGGSERLSSIRWCISFDEFLAQGRTRITGRDAVGTRWSTRRGPDDLAILVYTSGTTGPPKGAMLSNRNIVTQMRHANDVLEYRDDEERIAFLPLCHVAERVAGCYYSIATGAVVKLCREPRDGA